MIFQFVPKLLAGTLYGTFHWAFFDSRFFRCFSSSAIFFSRSIFLLSAVFPGIFIVCAHLSSIFASDAKKTSLGFLQRFLEYCDEMECFLLHETLWMDYEALGRELRPEIAHHELF